MKSLTSLVVILMSFFITAQTKYPEINQEIDKGNFKIAAEMINQKIALDQSLTSSEKWDLNFQIEKMDRIKRDFRRSREEVKSSLLKFYPDLTDEMMEKWEKEKSLEMRVIDGEKRYFSNSVPNLFRISKEAAELKMKLSGPAVAGKDSILAINIPSTIEKVSNGNENNANPVIITLDYTLTVDADAVPEGEIVRCWLPYPREDNRRQTDINFISANVENYIIADNNYQQRTLYMEKSAEKGKPVVFNMKLSYTSKAEWNNIDPQKIKPYNKHSELYKAYTSERLPHIRFSDEFRRLSEEIVGDEKNPFLIAKKLFIWIDDNIPWASAREYSTIDNIPEYAFENKHGDCGIQTLLFMTLARMNGIPAKWQSGWMMHPGEINLHDWSEIYFEGYGWVPVDQSFGKRNSPDEKVKYFYLGGTDSYRLIVNDDYSQPLFPAKTYPRSETVDFQRGEVEWRGGNLYFDKWDYNMKVEYSEK